MSQAKHLLQCTRREHVYEHQLDRVLQPGAQRVHSLIHIRLEGKKELRTILEECEIDTLYINVTNCLADKIFGPDLARTQL